MVIRGDHPDHMYVHDAQAVLVAGSVAPGRKKFVCTTWESSIQILFRPAATIIVK